MNFVDKMMGNTLKSINVDFNGRISIFFKQNLTLGAETRVSSRNNSSNPQQHQRGNSIIFKRISKLWNMNFVDKTAGNVVKSSKTESQWKSHNFWGEIVLGDGEMRVEWKQVGWCPSLPKWKFANSKANFKIMKNELCRRNCEKDDGSNEN